MKELLWELDSILAHIEDYLHGNEAKDIELARRITNKLMTYSFSPEAQELSVNEYLEQDWWLQNNEVPWQAIETAYISGIEATLKRFGL